ncbi:hypothetical protein HN587_07995 [Candidatus Woesearchaeota archaeon]|nr:hypothetical protein [Candidatus Woesearchaeota archaeon]
MAEDEEYAIVSQKEFSGLKKELEKFKKNPFSSAKEGESLQDSISGLNSSLTTMMEVFKTAADEMKIEEHDTELVTKQMGPIKEQLDMLIEQNQKIAKGIVAIADMVREKFEEMDKTLSEFKNSHPNDSAKPKAPIPPPQPSLPPLSGGPAPDFGNPTQNNNQFPPQGMPPGPAPDFGAPMPDNNQFGPPGNFAPQGAPDLPPLDGPGMPPEMQPPQNMAPQGMPPGPMNAPPQGAPEKKSLFGGLMK